VLAVLQSLLKGSLVGHETAAQSALLGVALIL
jgi:hypothetical protein